MTIAYLDPGSSSAILGAVAAGVGGAAVAGKAALSRFRRKKKISEPDSLELSDEESSSQSDDVADDTVVESAEESETFQS